MGLFDRMSRAASANFNALLDRIEDPKKDVELTVREMEEQVRLARAEIVSSVAAEKQLRKKGEDFASEIDRWERRAELAVKHGDDNLAKEALRQKRRLVGERERAEALRVEQRDLALTQKTELERMERTVSDVKARRGLIAARIGQARGGGSVEGLGARAGSDAFGEFRRMEDQIEGVEAAMAAEREVNEALREGSSPTGLSRDEVEAKFRALEATSGAPAGGDDVDEELRALKAKVRVEP